MFDPVDPRVSFPELDQRHLDFWDRESIFEATRSASKGKPPFVFYEGPPTANGMPHAGHVLTRVMKDVFLRYRSMDGFDVERHAGWDTHGLPVEVEVEKALGISGREAIEEYGVEAFSKKCVESVFKYIDEWRKMTRRIGFWLDMDKPYVTFHKSYVESVWWALKTLFDKGLLYQDYKVVWWWPQGGTALSSGEVGEGYQEVDDPSVFCRFGVKGQTSDDATNTSFLAWTTTPWTLPSNIALAVDPKQTYVTVQLESERVVLAKALVSKLLGDVEDEAIIEEKLGAEWVGTEYEPPFRYAEPEGGAAYQVIEGDFVTVDSGSGMVHIAPAFGEDDFRVCKEAGLGFLQLVKPDGTFPDEVTDFAGRFCKDADRDIIRLMRKKGVLFKEEVYRHEYPFCPRRKSDPLIQYARRSWFIRTTSKIDKVIANNKQVAWVPDHIQEGRFGAFLRTNVDWALSRERFWGTPLPIWINDETGAMHAVASAAEIEALNPNAFAKFDAAKAENPELSDDLKVHKPWVDDVTFQKEGEAGTYRRVTEVIDCWFDSGCMPFAQWGYPHQNEALFAETHPADFISEAVDQTRGWFYSLMMISTLLFEDKPAPHPFKNCTVLGFITDEKGRKMGKRLKNYTDPVEVMEKHGADAVRWALYANTTPGQNTKFHERLVTDALREFLLKIWNCYSFLVTYGNIDGFDPAAEAPPVAERHDLDRWVLAELDVCIAECRTHLDGFLCAKAAKRLERFVDGLSNWYVRRSRSRFWASNEDASAAADKRAAFHTLYEVLVALSTLSAPFVPFLAEELHQKLTRKGDSSAPPSVHQMPFPAERGVDDAELRASMQTARDVIALGQRVRAERKLKVRQPLGEAIVVVESDADRASAERFKEAITEELNIKRLEFTSEPAKYVEFSLLPNFRKLGPKLGKKVPLCKKALANADAAALQAELEANGEFSIEIDGESVTLTKDEVDVRLSAKEGFAAAAAHGRVVVVDTTVTPELKREGIAREIINRVQRARKDMDLAYDARIQVTYASEGQLAEAAKEHAERIMSETLATRFEPGETSDNATTIEGGEFAFSVDVVAV